MIAVGDCQIEYVAGDERPAGYGNMDTTNESESDNANPNSPGSDLDDDIELLELDPATTTSSAGRRARK